jgi:hypothetical protein
VSEDVRKTRLEIDFQDWLNQIKDHLSPLVGKS